MVDDLQRVLAALADRRPSHVVPDLDRIRAVLDLLGSPQRAYPSIHLTGTNGKSSTARMVDALLRAAGVRTGRYTSPHLESVTERVSVDGEPLSPERFAAAYDDVAPYVDIVDASGPERITFFELLTALALAAFADAPVDVAVVEVGLGGRWDATNVLDAPVAVVTGVSLDHREYLGDDLAAIAGEKAGIITAGAVAVLAAQELAAAEVLVRRCAEVGATVAREGLEFGVRSRVPAVGGQQLALQGLAGVYEDVFLPLHGAHQASNAACALAAVEAFLGGAAGSGPLAAEVVREGFAAVESPGRLEAVRTSPTVLLDAAHNPAGARALAATLEEAFTFERLVGVVGVLDDKDAEGLLEALEPVLDAVVCTESASDRALPAEELGDVAAGVFGDDRVVVEARLDDAIDRAVTLAEGSGAGTGTGVVVTGSVVTVGEARALLRRADG